MDVYTSKILIIRLLAIGTSLSVSDLRIIIGATQCAGDIFKIDQKFEAQTAFSNYYDGKNV